MRLLLPFLALAFAAAAPAAGQVRPQPGPGDAHLQTIEYKEGQVVLLELAPGYQMTVELAPDEQIENIALGDSGAWQVSANRRGDRLFIKALQSGVTTNLTVITNSRLYAIDLAPLFSPSPTMAYVVRFKYPEPDTEEPGAVAVDGRYRLEGERTLRPARISDDGRATYIEWAKEVVLPAVYAVDDKGKEMLVNGQMREGLFVIDAVYRELVFRIDDQSARAIRVLPRKRR